MDGTSGRSDGRAGSPARLGKRALKTVHDVLDGSRDYRPAKIFQSFIIALIVINVTVVIIETEELPVDEYIHVFVAFENFSIAVFTAEYAARLATCKMGPAGAQRWRVLRFTLSPMMLVDLAAILPFYLPFVVADTRFFRLLRLLLFFKMARYSESIQTLGNVFRAKATDLAVAFFILFIALIFSSSLMYFAENEAQPEVFSSIPASMWWGVITLTTIGYGDSYPVTVAGRLLAGTVAITGIAVYAIPTGIMASAFVEELRRKRSATRTCPHCGGDVPG